MLLARNRISTLFLLLVLLMVPQTAFAKTRAVLVGISDYYNLNPQFDLKGPKNDVREVARYLLEQGVAKEDIVLLSDPDAMPGGELTPKAPVKKAIFDALDEAAALSSEGDRVIFYFSGHGSLQPDLNGDELGGRDEIFLPADVGTWNDGIGAVENAIIDDELGIKMAAIRDKGATLFAIIDACFSGTGFRGVSGDETGKREKSRFVPEEAFGIPKMDIPASLSSAKPAKIPETGDDKFVYFYASQADQRSWEYPVSKGAGDDQWFGDFTFTLLQVLRRSPTATYRQVMQDVTARMRGRIGAKLQQPDYEGTLLDEPIWPTASGTTKRRYRLEGGELQAGILDGINENAIVSLFAIATDTKPVAYAKVVDIEATRAGLQAVNYPCADNCDSAQNIPQTARFAEIIENPANVAAVFSRLKTGAGGKPENIGELVDAIEGLANDRESGFLIDDNNFDLSLIWAKDKLIIGDRGGGYDGLGKGTSLRFSLPKGRTWREHLPEILTRVSRVHALYQISESLGAGGGLLGSLGKGIKTRMLVESAAPEQRTKARCRRKKKRASSQLKPLDSNQPLSHCDRVTIEITNKAVKLQDVTVLYVDANLGISALWPRGGKSNRIGYGETVRLPIAIVTKSRSGKPLATGLERVVVLSVPVEKETSERVVLTGITQPGVTLRGRGSKSENYLQAVFNPQSRSRSILDGDLTPPLNVDLLELITTQPENLEKQQ